jgi:outer membrane protein OmpA-like peptidoglycan-associated protein
MQVRQKIFMAATVLIILAGCTTPYTNKELLGIFKAKGLETQERDQGIVVFLPGIFFEVGKAGLIPPARLKVNEIASVVNDPRVVNRNLLLEGHTDSTGSDEDNLDLSNRRAESVHQGMLAGKVAANRMSTRGFGEKYPVADNTTPNGQAKNRRVEVVVKNPDTKG